MVEDEQVRTMRRGGRVLVAEFAPLRLLPRSDTLSRLLLEDATFPSPLLRSAAYGIVLRLLPYGTAYVICRHWFF
jgi:hypothetical protein